MRDSEWLIILIFLSKTQFDQVTEKNQKTSTNQSTKFHQLQAIFGHQGTNIKDIANLQNNLINSKNSSPNGSLENINLIYSENEVSLSDYRFTY